AACRPDGETARALRVLRDHRELAVPVHLSVPRAARLAQVAQPPLEQGVHPVGAFRRPGAALPAAPGPPEPRLPGHVATAWPEERDALIGQVRICGGPGWETTLGSPTVRSGPSATGRGPPESGGVRGRAITSLVRKGGRRPTSRRSGRQGLTFPRPGRKAVLTGDAVVYHGKGLGTPGPAAGSGDGADGRSKGCRSMNTRASEAGAGGEPSGQDRREFARVALTGALGAVALLRPAGEA